MTCNCAPIRRGLSRALRRGQISKATKAVVLGVKEMAKQVRKPSVVSSGRPRHG